MEKYIKMPKILLFSTILFTLERMILGAHIDPSSPNFFLHTWTMTNNTFPEVSAESLACFPIGDVVINSTPDGYLQFNSNKWEGTLCESMRPNNFTIKISNTTSFQNVQPPLEISMPNLALAIYRYNSTIDGNIQSLSFYFDMYFLKTPEGIPYSWNFQVSRNETDSKAKQQQITFDNHTQKETEIKDRNQDKHFLQY